MLLAGLLRLLWRAPDAVIGAFPNVSNPFASSNYVVRGTAPPAAANQLRGEAEQARAWVATYADPEDAPRYLPASTVRRRRHGSSIVPTCPAVQPPPSTSIS